MHSAKYPVISPSEPAPVHLQGSVGSASIKKYFFKKENMFSVAVQSVSVGIRLLLMWPPERLITHVFSYASPLALALPSRHQHDLRQKIIQWKIIQQSSSAERRSWSQLCIHQTPEQLLRVAKQLGNIVTIQRNMKMQLYLEFFEKD